MPGPAAAGRPGGCWTNNLTNKNFYVNVKLAKTLVEMQYAVWSIDSQEKQ